MMKKYLPDRDQWGDYQLVKEFKSKQNRVFLFRAGAGETGDSRPDHLILKKMEWGSGKGAATLKDEEILTVGKGWKAAEIGKEGEGWKAYETGQEAEVPKAAEAGKEAEVLKAAETGKEAEILKRLAEAGIRVPSLYYADEELLVMEYIPGPTMLDYLCGLEEQGTAVHRVLTVFSRLADWLQGFYSAPGGQGTILGDVNFRNFILSGEDSIYRVDFEDCRPGRVEEDIGRFCAFGLTYVPVFTDWKREVYQAAFRYLVKRLRLDYSLTGFYLKDELRAIVKRRVCSLPGSDSFLQVLGV